MTASPEEPLHVPSLEDLEWEEYAQILHEINKAEPDEGATGH